ncbi:MAG: sulfatase-like hydrolase/transferase [Legionella sp.]|nr:sulfatase-like hydrolase/transferase [Legionella sp.]
MFLLLNGCFFGLQLLYVYSEAGSFISAIRMPWTVYEELLATLCVHLVLYTLLSLIQGYILQKLLAVRTFYFSKEGWQIIIWSMSVCALLSANAYYFPLSVFGELLISLFPSPILLILLSFSLICLGCITMYAVSATVIDAIRLKKIKIGHLFIIVLLSFILLNSQRPELSVPQVLPVQKSQPNIIILGIDSLSLESVNAHTMPFLFKHLKNSTQFTNTISPLARTFPAWCSILTGLYTKHHHAYENLVAKPTVRRKASIVWTLNELGYNTVFASDDRRFNGLDKQFGFQNILGPKLGVNDVLLGAFNDFPLSNLIINFPISAWLFPYNHMNRASNFSYYPQTFNTSLEKEIGRIQKSNKPLFLAVHFTLPHWPYSWADSDPELTNDKMNPGNPDLLYISALSRVDKQFESLYMFLKDNHLLDTSILLTLSDHGEVLYDKNARLTNNSNYQGKLPSALADYLEHKTSTELNKSVGHGSDILSPGQYHSILAFHLNSQGQTVNPKISIATRTALIDIAPTLLDFLKIKNNSMDGISLLASILNGKNLPEHRSFFIESGMFPNQDISKKQALVLGKQLYKVNKNNGELELKTKQVKKINQQKLYGIIKDEWVLALYPKEASYLAVIQNLKTGQWIDDLNSDFAKLSPAKSLFQELQHFYDKKFFDPQQSG